MNGNRGAKVQDSELVAMNKAVKLLAELDPVVRSRVLKWLNIRFEEKAEPYSPPAVTFEYERRSADKAPAEK